MPVIQDPRQNPGNEHNLGIAYIEENYKIDGVTYFKGHHFYKKKGNPNDPFNIRYLSQGFPVLVTGRTETDAHDWEGVDWDKFKEMFPNLQDTRPYVLTLEANPGYIEDNPPDIDSARPISAYVERNLEGELKKFNQGRRFRYNRDQNILELIP